MENRNNQNYGQYDPDFIEQDTPIDNAVSTFYDDEYQFQHQNEENYGEYDPDFMEQNITVEENQNAVYEESTDQYEFETGFTDDSNHEINDFNRNEMLKAENIPNEERIINEDGLITNDEEPSELENNNDDEDDLDYEDDLEKDGDLDNDEEMDDFDAEHYPENHPRE